MRRRIEIGLAAFSILAAIVHFAGELAYHTRFGQFLPGLWVDWLADALLLVAAIRALRGPGAAGLLCGAWGYTFCLNWVAFNEFLLRVLEDRVSASVTETLSLLAVALVFSATAFAVSLGLAWRRAEPRR